MRKTAICRVEELPEGRTRTFEFQDADGLWREGFVANFQGSFVAYENTCRHLPLSLDYGDNRFFTRDGGHFLCQHHGATYEPLTGLCVRGPCQGAKLKSLRIEVADGCLWLAGEEKPA